eukprot:TRINITY_DN667_c0_g2_i1.p1 TRINITY_DN667_c0_g2~~TRINITY_DN667_c0_g2_i1.p1  ORF type:complete len:944 (+),score=349.17 TRINITY_DN667_c0_g2_i1:45-2876(+)
MAQQPEPPCYLLVGMDKQAPTPKELKEAIEKGGTKERIQAVKDMIALTLNGEPQTKLIMSVIKFIQPSGTTTSSNEKNDASVHTLKKLVLYFWEVVEKVDAQGKLLPELILLVDFLRRDLAHPNEFIRGATLRFLCNLKEKEILEPLAPTVLDCLVHRHSYVRRNAILAITNIYKRIPEALPDAPETVEQLLAQETDVTAKRNAFLMLFTCTPDRAVSYLRSIMDTDLGQSQNDVFQLAIVELLKQLMQTNPHEKSEYITVIFTLLQSKSQAVLFQCASTLLALSSSPTAIKASATTLVNLLNAHCDNNVKLVVLGKLEDIKKSFPETLQELSMDLLRCLVGSEVEIQRRILELTLDLVTAKNIEKVIQFLKKELIESTDSTTPVAKGETDYRQLLIKFIHQSTVRHRQVAPMIVPILMDFIVEDSKPAVDTILFIREMVHRQAELREEVITKLAIHFNAISATRVFRIALWILGSHSKTYEEIRNIMSALRAALDPFPLWLKEKTEEEEEETGISTAGGGATVREDGTYVMAVVPEKEEKKTEVTSFRSLITEGDFFLSAVLASTLVKLVCSCWALNISTKEKEHVKNDALTMLDELIQLGIHKQIDADSHERLRLCKKLIGVPTNPMTKKYTEMMLKGFSDMLQEEDDAKQEETQKEEEKKFVPIDQPIHFSQLVRTKRGDKGALIDLEDVSVAAKNEVLSNDQNQKMKNVLQLTGFSDPVYVEGTVEVHQFDILLEMLVVNKTEDTLQNLTVELGTVGDLRLCERPQSYTVAPGEEVTIKANMKVSSTEAGVIFGNIVYDSTKAGSDQTVIVLNDLHMDIIDYVHPASCNATVFRTMWQDFEWENRLIVATEIKSLREYLDHILKHTNMRCQAMSTSLAGEADFLSANLLAKSSFGEPVVANISVSKTVNGNIEGYVRIRSRSQGIALGLGDKITIKQKG